MLYSISESQFAAEVLAEPGLVLVNFWAPWCGICRLIDPLLNKFQTDWQGSVKLVSVNADQSLQLAADYRLTSLPTLILFQGGQLSYRLEHFEGKQEFLATLNGAMRSLSEVLS